MSALAIESLTLSIRGKPILRGVSLSIAPGEILALVGASGSGKSMTLLSAMGLAPADAQIAGAVRLGDEQLIGAPEHRLRALRGGAIGMVFQEPMTALNPVRTLRYQVAETVRLHKSVSQDEANARAIAALRRVGLSDALAARYPHEVSGGQRQRAAIAAATVLSPRVLLADEPTTALDVTAQAEIMDLFRARVRDDKMSLLLVTHDLALASQVADRISLMQDGAILEQSATPLRGFETSYGQALFRAASPSPMKARPAKGAALLEVEDARVIYRERNGDCVEGVDRVSFALAEGEALAIVGESGSGKSSLARAVLGLTPLAGGAVRIGGVSIAKAKGAQLRALRRQAQIVFQDPAGSFDPRWRVAQIVAEPLHLLNEPMTRAEKRRRVGDALTDVGLDPAMGALRPHEFSGGQRQRIAIARALITSPKLVVFDEAVSALDMSARALVLELLAELRARRGFSYLFITHDLSIVRAVAERVLVMRAGRAVEQGETERVFASPQDAYTSTLIAATPML